MTPIARFACVSAALLAAGCAFGASVGERVRAGYPVKPIRVVVGFAPGGSVDLVARTLAQKLTATYGRQVLVDNRPGAASHIAGNIVAKAEPDGYTILVSSQGGLGTNLALYRHIPYNAIDDLTPIALLVHQAQILIISPKLEVKSVKELIALARSKPGALNYGSAGIGGPIHLGSELFDQMAGIKMNHVVYKGGALALVDLLNGQIQVMSQPLPEALPYIKDGRVRALGITTDKRSALLPDIPTIAEAGLSGYSFASWMGAAGPAGMAKGLTRQISTDWNKALSAPDVQTRLVGLGLELAGGTPEELGARMRSELERTMKLVKAVGIAPVD